MKTDCLVCFHLRSLLELDNKCGLGCKNAPGSLLEFSICYRCPLPDIFRKDLRTTHIVVKNRIVCALLITFLKCIILLNLKRVTLLDIEVGHSKSHEILVLEL